MKAIMVMFDSLNRHMLPPYGCDWVHAPNFQRLAERAVTFDNCYIASMPCMPARRELHTGRYNFLHRSWGPLEPFDDSMPETLRENGVHSHLITDHMHYLEDGGGTYHTRYTTWECNRGQEGDLWKGHVEPDFPIPERTSTIIRDHHWQMWPQEFINRRYMPTVEQHYQTRTFNDGLHFIHTNAAADNWYLQIETFDPHEPFFSHPEIKALYPHEYDGPPFDWPPYNRITQSDDMVQHAIYEYAALLSMCDASLGRVLDAMDELNLWDDTLLIVNTDHGYLLSEHGWWGKARMPWYNEMAHTPLFIWDPRSGKRAERRQSLVQMIDLPATLLDYFGLEQPPDMLGKALQATIADDIPVREYALFGAHGSHVNITDGRYIYMRGVAGERNAPLYEYTLMPTHVRSRFAPEEMRGMTLAAPFSFTKDCCVLQIETRQPHSHVVDIDFLFQNYLWDTKTDPGQQNPLTDPALERHLSEQMVKLMREHDAPKEQYERLGLTEFLN